MEVLRHTLSKEYLFLISHCDSAFAVWNALTSPEQQTTNNVEKESSGDESDQACFMVQGNDSLEVNLDTLLLLGKVSLNTRSKYRYCLHHMVHQR